MPAPKISILMSVYNGEQYLREAVDSILAQTFGDFEFLIVDDGSTDSSLALLHEYAQRDQRVRVIQQQNQGLTKSLNAAGQLAQGEYIARMDADDISLPTRFQQQVEFLDQHPEYLAVGTAYQRIDPHGDLGATRIVMTDAGQIAETLLTGDTALPHPTLMIRREAFNQVGGYNDAFRTSQDLDLLLRLSECGPLSNLPETLLHYRVHDNNISLKKADQQDRDVTGIIAAAYERRGLPAPQGVPEKRWLWRRKMARSLGLQGKRLQGFQFACQAIKMRPFAPASWYTLLTFGIPWHRKPRSAPQERPPVSST